MYTSLSLSAYMYNIIYILCMQITIDLLSLYEQIATPDSKDSAESMFKSRDISGTSDLSADVAELQNRSPLTPTVERDSAGFFGHMDSTNLK